MPYIIFRFTLPILILGISFSLARAKDPGSSAHAITHDLTSGLKLIEEIDPAKIEPVFESSPGASVVQTVLGKSSRAMQPGEESKAFAYIIGKGKGLQPGKAYILEVEYPDDVPRTIYLANRGADYVRGMSTGAAFGDVRAQYAEPSVESLSRE
jgi:hypothetical protein